MIHAACCLALAFGLAGTYQRLLELPVVSDAILIGRSREGELARFHEVYRFRVDKPPVDLVELVTPFRQVVLAAEARARSGAGLFTQREGVDLAQAFGDRLDVLVEMTFHPLNRYVTVPEFEVTLESPTGTAIPPREIARTPRVGAAIQAGAPILGASLAAQFDGPGIDATAVYDVVIRERATEIGRVKVNLGAVR